MQLFFSKEAHVSILNSRFRQKHCINFWTAFLFHFYFLSFPPFKILNSRLGKTWPIICDCQNFVLLLFYFYVVLISNIFNFGIPENIFIFGHDPKIYSFWDKFFIMAISDDRIDVYNRFHSKFPDSKLAILSIICPKLFIKISWNFWYSSIFMEEKKIFKYMCEI